MMKRKLKSSQRRLLRPRQLRHKQKNKKQKKQKNKKNKKNKKIGPSGPCTYEEKLNFILKLEEIRMATIWRLDFGLNYGEVINKICNQEQLNQLNYENVNYMKYYYGQIEVSTTHGNCKGIAIDLYKWYKCPIKISIEDEYGNDIIESVSYHPSLRKYESDPSDSDSDSDDESDDEYKAVDKVYNNWKLTRTEKETEKVKKIIKILDGCCFKNDDCDIEYDYTYVDKAYKNWIHTRPNVDFESEEEIRIIKLLEGCEKCYCTFCD
jgi:hypothetical protein